MLRVWGLRLGSKVWGVGLWLLEQELTPDLASGRERNTWTIRKKHATEHHYPSSRELKK